MCFWNNLGMHSSKGILFFSSPVRNTKSLQNKFVSRNKMGVFAEIKTMSLIPNFLHHTCVHINEMSFETLLIAKQ